MAYPNITYRPRVCSTCFPNITYRARRQPCEIVRPVDYPYMSWFGIPLPDYSFSIEPETKERKIDQVMAQLRAGVESIQNSDVFRQFLTTMAKFHDYSFGNQMLIMLQHPSATRVAGFQMWKDLGRWVKAGEHGIAILAPCMPARTLACPLCGTGMTERELRQHLTEVHKQSPTAITSLIRQARVGAEGALAPVSFKVVYVFDVSQTSGKELPEVSVPSLSGEANEPLYARALEIASNSGLTVDTTSRPTMSPDVKGSLSGTTIWIRPEESRAQQLKTLLHELAHYFTERVFGIPRADAETIAESATFVTAAHFGFDTGTRSFNYVAVWSLNKKVLEKNLAAIRNVSDRMITMLEGVAIEASYLEEHLKYAARERDFIATVGLSTNVEPIQLKSGKWRAYLTDFMTRSPRGFEAESREVVRDGYDNIITGDSREDLINKLKAEYPGWKWEKPRERFNA